MQDPLTIEQAQVWAKYHNNLGEIADGIQEKDSIINQLVEELRLLKEKLKLLEKASEESKKDADNKHN